MDNPATESSTAPLNTLDAANLFSQLLDPPADEPEREDDPAATPPADPDAPAEAPESPEAAEASEDDPTVTVKIDGKPVEIKLSELKNGYQRQADYTRKTMEVSEQRKAAEAEVAKAQSERQAYAANLQRMQIQLEGALQQQQQTNWEELLSSDPVEYLKQQHLAQQRQAALNQVYAEQQKVASFQQAEVQKSRVAYLAQQQAELLAKLPEWKDEAKGKAEKVALREYLQKEGFEQSTIDTITDAKAVLMARKAMLYDQMMSKAATAAKKVATLPSKVERPGSGDNPGLDRRNAAYQRLSKSGRVDDAAAVFASLL